MDHSFAVSKRGIHCPGWSWKWQTHQLWHMPTDFAITDLVFPICFPTPSLPFFSFCPGLGASLLQRCSLYTPNNMPFPHAFEKRVSLVRRRPEADPMPLSGLSLQAQAFPFLSVLHHFVPLSFKRSLYFRPYLKAHWVFCLQCYFAEL